MTSALAWSDRHILVAYMKLGFRVPSAAGVKARCGGVLAGLAALGGVLSVRSQMLSEVEFVSPVWHWVGGAATAVGILASVWMQGLARVESATFADIGVSEVRLGASGARLSFSSDDETHGSLLRVAVAGLLATGLLAGILFGIGIIAGMAGMVVVASVLSHVAIANVLLAGAGLMSVATAENLPLVRGVAERFGGGPRTTTAARVLAAAAGGGVVLTTIAASTARDPDAGAAVAALASMAAVVGVLRLSRQRLSRSLRPQSVVATLADGMKPVCVTVSEDSAAVEALAALENASTRVGDGCGNETQAAVVVDADGEVTGVIWREALNDISAVEQMATSVYAVMAPVEFAAHDDPLLDVLYSATCDVLVTDGDGRVVGIVARSHRTGSSRLAA